MAQFEDVDLAMDLNESAESKGEAIAFGAAAAARADALSGKAPSEGSDDGATDE